MKDAYIAAKERWARKMRAKQSPPHHSGNRLPPAQRLLHDFPVLDLGVQPEVTLAQWELRIHGLVEKPLPLN